MKALSLKQPWANLVRDGIKTIETRVWGTEYRGDILICSSKTLDQEAYEYFGIDLSLKYRNSMRRIDLGYALCVVKLYDCMPMHKLDEKLACCEVYPKAMSWFLGNVRLIKPFKVKGHQSIRDIEQWGIKPEEIIYL